IPGGHHQGRFCPVPAGQHCLHLLPDWLLAAEQARRQAAARQPRRTRAGLRPVAATVAEIVVRREVDSAGHGQCAVAPRSTQLLENTGPAILECHGSFGKGARTKARNSSASSWANGFGAVSSFSPKKIEFAPARKHSTSHSRLSRSRPALRRTRAPGKARRVVAIRRTSSRESTGAAPCS